MEQNKFKLAYIFSGIVIFLMTIASATGLFWDGLYRDNAFVKMTWFGNDIVTLFVVVPLAFVTWIRSMCGSQRSQLIWLGTMLYAIYNYAFYLFGTAFNVLFLVYVGLLTFSILTLILGLSKINADAVSAQFRPVTPVKAIAGFMFVFAAMMSILWISMTFDFILTGNLPEMLQKTGHPTQLVFALDLGLLVPGLLLSAVLLWKRHAWGYIAAAIVLIKANTYGMVMISMHTYAVLTTGTGDSLIGLWAALTTASLISSGFLLGNLQPTHADAPLPSSTSKIVIPEFHVTKSMKGKLPS